VCNGTVVADSTNKMKKTIFILFLLISFLSFSQNKPNETQGNLSGYLVKATVVNGDTFPLINLPDVRIMDQMVFKSQKQAEKFTRLKRDVKKAYPYAILAAAKLKECNAKMATMPLEAERKLYMKRVEKEVVKQFEGDMRNLTLSQGKILIKLIDRETGSSSYELVKELRGTFSAWMWQSLAVFFGANLKSEYDATGNDKMIEQAIYLVESGEI